MVGITKGRAWKAKQIAKAVVEGDASRQYSMLWRYAAELKRVCPGNNCKINMERPAPTLQPRFVSTYALMGVNRDSLLHVDHLLVLMGVT